MMNRPAMTLTAVVLGARDANALAAFYRDLLGWEVRSEEPGWVALTNPGGSERVFLDPAGHPFCLWVSE